MRRPRIALVLACVLSTASASAAGGAYAKGVELEKQGDVLGALAAFESIAPHDRDWNTRLHIASCKERLGRYKAALADYDAIRADATADEATRETAAANGSDLRSRIPVLRLNVRGSGVSVFVDGQGTHAGRVELDPGRHRITAKRGDRVVYERTVDLSDSSSVEVVVDVPDEQAVVVAKAPDTHPARSNADPLRTTAIVMGGVGIAALTGGAFFALRASSLRSEADDLARRGDESAYDRTSSARASQTLARIGLGLGTAAVGAGVVLYLVSPKSPTGPSVTVGATQQGLGLSLGGSF